MARRRSAVVALVFLFNVGPAWGAELMSYEAVYDVRLQHASGSFGPRAVTGVFESRFAETCGGWDQKTHIKLNLLFADGAPTTNERFFSSFESKNGHDYSFAAVTFRDGKRIESYKGAAVLGRRGGKATYEVPARNGEGGRRTVTLDLPKGTLFPAAHSRLVLDKAASGGPFHSSVVLNGSSSVGPRLHAIAIGPPLVDSAEVLDPKLAQYPSWRMNEALFNLNDKRDIPNTEMFQRVFQPGVLESFEQTFGDFTVSAKLSHLRWIDPPSCPQS
jgi:hypothetical protein